MYTICLPGGAHRGQKSATNPLELELKMGVSHLCVLRLRPGSPGEVARAPLLNYLSSTCLASFKTLTLHMFSHTIVLPGYHSV